MKCGWMPLGMKDAAARRATGDESGFLFPYLLPPSFACTTPCHVAVSARDCRWLRPPTYLMLYARALLARGDWTSEL